MSGSSRSVAVSTDARICSRGLKATVAVALAASAAQVIDLAVLDPGSRLLDMNTHASLFGVVSLLALAAACGAGLLLVTYPAANGRARIVLPLLLAALLGLRLLHPAGVIFYAIPLVAVTFPVLWWHVATPGPTRNVSSASVASHWPAHTSCARWATSSPDPDTTTRGGRSRRGSSSGTPASSRAGWPWQPG